MNYTEIAAAHELEYNRPDKTALTPQWVEDAYRDVMSRRKFSWLYAITVRTTSPDVCRYALPSDFYSVVNVLFSDGVNSSWALNMYTAEEFDVLHPHPDEDTASKPEDGCISSSIDSMYASFSELVIWPKPDVATYTLTMKYEIIAPTLTGTVVPTIPARYHQVLVFGALHRGFAHVREYEAAMYWEKRYEQMIGRMIEDDKYTPVRNGVMHPFRGGVGVYPPDYWKKYEVKGAR
jgi:hypothetical protein